MANLSRRKQATPVRVRRVEGTGETEQVAIPPAQTGGVAPPAVPPAGPVAPASGTAQTFIFVAAGMSPAPAPTPAPPQIIHHHHTTHVHPAQATLRQRIRVEAPKRLSLLGLLSFLIGGFGCYLSYRPLARFDPIPVGTAGVIIGFAAFLPAALIRRTSAAMPLAGMIVSGAAIAIGFGAGSMLREEIEPRTLEMIDRFTGPAPVPATLPAVPLQTLTPAWPQALEKEPVSARGGVSDEDLRQTALAVARQRRELAIDRVVMNRPDYIEAKKEVEAAQAVLNQRRADRLPGSVDLIAADQRMMNAKVRVLRIRDDAGLSSDPGVKAANADLAAALGVGQSESVAGHAAHP